MYTVPRRSPLPCGIDADPNPVEQYVVTAPVCLAASFICTTPSSAHMVRICTLKICPSSLYLVSSTSYTILLGKHIVRKQEAHHDATYHANALSTTWCALQGIARPAATRPRLAGQSLAACLPAVEHACVALPAQWPRSCTRNPRRVTLGGSSAENGQQAAGRHFGCQVKRREAS